MTTPLAALDRPGEGRVYPIPTDDGELVELPNTTGMFPEAKHIWEWKIKMTLLGATHREDVAVQVAAGNLLPAGPPRNSELRRLAEVAQVAGQIVEKGHLANDRGTGFHSLTERLDELVPAGQVRMVDELGLPKSMREIAKEYVACMAGVEIVRSEITVASFADRFAGTIDRIIRFRPLDAWRQAFDQYDLGRGCFAFDNKFGKGVHDEAAMQLAAATLAEFSWDATTQTKAPLPDDLRTDIGFVFNPDRGLVVVDLTDAADAFLGLVAYRRFCERKPIGPALGKIPQSSPSAGADGETGVRGGDVGPVLGGTATAAPAPSAPTHIADVLSQVIAAIPDEPEFDVDGDGNGPAEDVFAGLPDDHGKPMPDRAAKTSELRRQYDDLVALSDSKGTEALQAVWPTDLLTMRAAAEAGHVYTLDELAQVELAIKAAASAVRLPWPDLDPNDPANQRVLNDDPRVLDLIARCKSLPSDLLAAVFSNVKAAGVPNLSLGYLTEAHLPLVEVEVAAGQAEWMPRCKRINDLFALLAEKNVSEAAVLATLDVASPKDIFDGKLESLDQLVDTVRLDIIVEQDGRLIVDQPAIVLNQYGGAGKVRTAARTLAKARGVDLPDTADAALADPLLTAALAVV